jgi:riboflavin kinase/FMN adenylyltransferase
MNIVSTAREVKTNGRKVCLAIGFFDGVHIGHQQIIRQTIHDAQQQEALALVITFDKHPNVVVAPDRVPPLIYALPIKLRTIETLKPETLLLIPFDAPFSRQSGESFIRGLKNDLGVIHRVCVGENFVFGYKRGGNVALLQELGQELSFTVHATTAVSLNGKVVSSTRIRELIQAGDLSGASQMLGRPYSLAGIVVAGDRLGRELGFPTANLDMSGLALPPTGVYAVHAQVQGKRHRAVMNIGRRPTLRSPDPELRVEAHLLDFSGDLYGQELEVVFLGKLREEKKFASLEDLRVQIARDLVEAASLFEQG